MNDPYSFETKRTAVTVTTKNNSEDDDNKENRKASAIDNKWQGNYKINTRLRKQQSTE
jgi:hypothetical protein